MQLNKLSKIQKEEFAPVYSDMTGQFPIFELKSYEHFIKYFDSDKYCFYRAGDIGYILFANIDDYIWVDYLAIFREYQSMGFGSKILDLIKEEKLKQIQDLLEQVYQISKVSNISTKEVQELFQIIFEENE